MSQPQQGWAPQQGQVQQYDPAAYQQQSPQGYGPPAQPAHAGPPQGYAPPQQQGYAPQPPYQQGQPQQMPYPPQQGYGGGYGPAPQQGGWGAPQGQPQQQQQAVVEPGTLGDFYSQPTVGWGPGLPWKDMPPGTTYTFRVARELTDADTEHQTKYGTNNTELDYFRDGRKKLILKIPGLIEQSQTFPDGRCLAYIGANERDELGRAMAEAGAEAGPPENGAVITITLTHHRKNRQNTWSAVKHIQYTTPDGRTSSPAPAIGPQQGYGGPPQGYGQPQYQPVPPQQPAQQYAPQQQQAPAPQQPAYQPPAQQPPQQYQPEPQAPAQQQYQPQPPAQQPPAQPQYQPPAGPPPQQPGVEQTQQQPAQPQGQVPPAPGATGELDPARAAKIAQLAGQ